MKAIPATFEPGVVSHRILICKTCQEKCADFRAFALQIVYTLSDCPLGKWPPLPALPAPTGNLLGNSTDHEKEAALAGFAPECCGAANEGRGPSTPRITGGP